MKMSFRQGIARYQTDLDNNQLFLKLSGGQVTLYVSPDPTIITISHGTSEYLYTESVTIPNAWGGIFNTFTDYWLYWDINLTTGVRTFGHTVVEPITQALAPPTTPVLDQHWFDTTTNTMKVWVGARWVEKVRVFAAKLAQGTTFLSMSAKTPIFSGTQSGYTNNFNSGAITFDLAGKPIKNSLGKFFTTEDLFTAGVPSGSSLKINTIIVDAQVQAPIAAFTVVQFIDFNKVTHADPHQQNSVVYGIVEEDAFTADNVRVVTEGRLTYDQWDWPADGAEVNDYLYISLTGELQLTQSIANQTPVGQVIDKQTIIFRPSVLKAILEGGVDDHSELTGLDSDDHNQYYNEVRGDIQYYPRSELEPILADKSDVGHTHAQSDVAGLETDLTGKVSKSGDVMDNAANITFVAGGEVLGLPAVPSSGPAATSKTYVDNQISGISVGDSWRIIDGDGDTYVRTESAADADEDTIVMVLGANPNDVDDEYVTPATVVTLGRASLDIIALNNTGALNGGAINLTAGNSEEVPGGSITLTGGDMHFSYHEGYAYGASVEIGGGKPNGYSDDSFGGDVNIIGGNTTSTFWGVPGDVNIAAGIRSTQTKVGNINIINTPAVNPLNSDITGGDVNIEGSEFDSLSTSADAGSVNISGGQNTGNGGGGNVSIRGGGGGYNGLFPAGAGGGSITMECGDGDIRGGSIKLHAGDTTDVGGSPSTASVSIKGGNTVAEGGGGAVTIQAGNSDLRRGGRLWLQAGSSSGLAVNPDPDGGEVYLEAGNANGYGHGGDITLKASFGSSTLGGGRAGNISMQLQANVNAPGQVDIKPHNFSLNSFEPELHLFHRSSVGSVALRTPQGLESAWILTLPVNNGDADQVLTTDGSGNTSWEDAAAGSPLTTKGDLFAYDTGDQRLAIGADNLVLTADAAEATGMKWAAGGETNTASNLGAGEGVFVSKSVADLQFKSLVAGTDVTITSDGTEITINSTGGGGGSSPLTTKGDLFTYAAADERLAIGANNFVLTADSTEPTGMKWAAGGGGGGGATWQIVDADGDTHVRTATTDVGDQDVVTITLGDGNGDDFDAGVVATFGRASIDITGLTANADYIAGGEINITGGDGYAGNDYGKAGGVNITGGIGDGYAYAGAVTISGGENTYGAGGAVTVSGGQGSYGSGTALLIGGTSSPYGIGGAAIVEGGTAHTVGNTRPGWAYLVGGKPDATSTGYGQGSVFLICGGKLGNYRYGDGGDIRMEAGESESAVGKTGGRVQIEGGGYGSTSFSDRCGIILEPATKIDGGDILLEAGDARANNAGRGGHITILGGESDGSTTFAGDVFIHGGLSDNGAVEGGDVNIVGGKATLSNGVAGHVILHAAEGDNTGAQGTIIIRGPQTGTSDVTAPELRFEEQYQNGTNYIGLKTPESVATSVTYDLPVAPTDHDVLQTTSAGVTSWVGLQYIATEAANTSFTITHSLGQRWVTVQVFNSSTGAMIVPATVTLTDANNLTVTIGASTAVKIVVIGVPNVT